MTYAIVKIGGHQEKVEENGIIVANRLPQKVGEKVELPVVLLAEGDKITVDPKKLKKAKVSAEVIDDKELGKKIDILKFKSKVRYTRRKGHRQKLTRLRVLSITAA